MHFNRVCAAVCATIVATLGFVRHSSADEKGQVTVASWGGTYQAALREAIFKPFEKATGIKVIEAIGPTMPKVHAMLNTGSPEWDVVDLLPGDYLQLEREGLLQKLDYSVMDPAVFADFPKEAVTPFGVGTCEYASVIAFNTKKWLVGEICGSFS